MRITRGGFERLRRCSPELKRRVGTPYYAYDWESLRTNAGWMVGALDRSQLAARSRLYLALFALPNLSLLRRLVLSDERLGLSCNSVEEVIALQRSGWTAWERVVFSGGVIPAHDLALVAQTGCLVNVASTGNLQALLDSSDHARVGLRVDYGGTHLKGIPLREVGRCVELAAQAGKPLFGLHAYPGTEVENLDVLIRHAMVLLEVGARYPCINEINLGGGFWYNYGSPDGDPSPMVDLDRYFGSVAGAPAVQKIPSLRLGWEPGRIVFANAGFFATSVVEVRETSPNTADVYVDASFTNLPVLKLRGRQHHVVALSREGDLKEGPVEFEGRVCGCTTLSTDLLLPRPCPLPRLDPGDLLVVYDVGAYGRAGSYNFLNKSTPPEVLLDDESWAVLRHRQRSDHLLEGLGDGE